jgi:hypothetical protein
MQFLKIIEYILQIITAMLMFIYIYQDYQYFQVYIKKMEIHSKLEMHLSDCMILFDFYD